MSGSRRFPAPALAVTVALAIALLAPLSAAEGQLLALSTDGAQLASTNLQLKITLPATADPQAVTRVLTDTGRQLTEVRLGPGEHSVSVADTGLGTGVHELVLIHGDARARSTIRLLPGWLSIVPPVIAIGLALAFKNVMVALFAGVFFGVLILDRWNPLLAFGHTIVDFILPALTLPDHAAVVIFSTLLAGMVGIISRSGGTLGIVERLRPYATSRRRGQLATWAMGIVIFFDDYANTLIVGSTMRPITDRLRISREKLAYIVDSTAAPIASVVPISTWIGYEVGLIDDAFRQLALPYNSYTTFIASIAYRFYPIFALVLGFAVAYSGRDFGPMLKAEKRVSETGKVLADGDVPIADFSSAALAPPEGKPLRARNALLPIATVIGATAIGLVINGSAGLDRSDFPSVFKWLQESISNANSFHVLLWSSLAGVMVAVALPLTQKILTVHQATDAMIEGFKSVMMAIAVLLLAWSIGDVCTQLGTAEFLVSGLSGSLAPALLPVLTFLIAAAVAFATGTSWATMAILIPLSIPVTHGLALASGYAADGPELYTLLLGTISSVLAGSVWGDHCSPISDTTILSSTASGSDHVAHVRTQMPYAFSIGILGMIVGDLPTAYGLSPWVSLVAGSILIVLGVRFLGRRPSVPQ